MIGRNASTIWSGVGVLMFGLGWWIWPGGVEIPSLAEVVGALILSAGSGELLRDAASSCFRVLTGTAIAFITATLLAFPAMVSKPVRHALSAVIELLRPVPPLAWVPLAIMSLGIGDKPAFAIVALGAFFPIWLSYLQGLDAVRPEHVQAARSLGAGPFDIIAYVIVPSIRPYVAHGLRVGGGIAWFCVVAAEMMGASSGLGHRVQLLSLNIQMDGVFAYLIAIGVLGTLFNVALERFEKSFALSENA